eukprot:1700828-Pleurochrysis_carterae.AAC.1
MSVNPVAYNMSVNPVALTANACMQLLQRALTHPCQSLQIAEKKAYRDSFDKVEDKEEWRAANADYQAALRVPRQAPLADVPNTKDV